MTPRQKLIEKIEKRIDELRTSYQSQQRALDSQSASYQHGLYHVGYQDGLKEAINTFSDLVPKRKVHNDSD